MHEFRSGKTTVISEISWPPLGVIYSYASHPMFDAMLDVTDWGRESFRTRREVYLVLPKRQVASPYPLAFGNAKEMADDEKRRLPAFLHHVPSTPETPTVLSALVEKV